MGLKSVESVMAVPERPWQRATWGYSKLCEKTPHRKWRQSHRQNFALDKYSLCERYHSNGSARNHRLHYSFWWMLVLGTAQLSENRSSRHAGPFSEISKWDLSAKATFLHFQQSRLWSSLLSGNRPAAFKPGLYVAGNVSFWTQRVHGLLICSGGQCTSGTYHSKLVNNYTVLPLLSTPFLNPVIDFAGRQREVFFRFVSNVGDWMLVKSKYFSVMYICFEEGVS